MKLILGCCLVLLMTSCSNSRHKTKVDRYEEPNPTFEKGMKALEEQQYGDAAKLFDRLLVSKPGTELELVTLYNSGAAYEGLGDCPKAIERYREVVSASAKRFQRMEAQALFRMSLMYECVGQDTKVIAALSDASKRGKFLPPETAQAEIPARLAAAYSRIDNREKAMFYFAEAGKGLKAIVSRGKRASRPQIDLLARTLFLMGQLNPAQRSGQVDPMDFLQSLSMQQPHLLQAVELDHSVYSVKAAEDLSLAYDNLWKFKLEDPAKRREFYIRSLQVANELEKLKLPDSIPPVQNVFKMLEQTEARLQTELTKVAETTKLTPEAEKREGLKRQGRLIDPSGAGNAHKKRKR